MTTDVKLANCLVVKCWRTLYRRWRVRTRFQTHSFHFEGSLQYSTWSWHTLSMTNLYTLYREGRWMWYHKWPTKKCAVHHTGLLTSHWMQSARLAPHTELWYRTQLDDGEPSSCYMNYWADYWEDFVHENRT